MSKILDIKSGSFPQQNSDLRLTYSNSDTREALKRACDV
jgi:hypothetical protein